MDRFVLWLADLIASVRDWFERAASGRLRSGGDQDDAGATPAESQPESAAESSAPSPDAALDRKTLVAVGIIVVAIFAGGGILVWWFRPVPPVGGLGTQVVYYDLSRGELFEDAADQMPPISRRLTGAPTAVRAHLFSCGECQPDEYFLGYLEKYSEGAKAALEEFGSMEAMQEAPMMTLEAYGLGPGGGGGQLIAAAPASGELDAEALEWVATNDPDAAAIRAAVHARCEGGRARRCTRLAGR